GAETRRLAGDHSHGVTALAITRDGNTLAAVGYDQVVRQWDCRTGEPLAIETDSSRGPRFVAWSPDARMISTYSLDGRIRLWDTETGKPLRDIRHSGQSAFLPGGKLLVS